MNKGFRLMRLCSFSIRHKASMSGSTNPVLPIVAAFLAFGSFAGVSLVVLLRSRTPSAPSAPAPSSGFPSVPASAPPTQAPPAVSTLQPGFPSSSPTPNQPPANSPFSQQPSSPASSNLDAAGARRIVESWLAYKKQIFSAPYDTSRIDQYVVNPGPLYSDITRAGGSVDWLRHNRASYFYNELSILDVSDFRQFPDRAHLTVRIIEDLELRTPAGVDRSKSGRKVQSWVYELKLDNGSWLVYDYRKDH